MGTRYSTQSISGYNATPPADDGTATEANRVTWAKHKTKLTDPIKTLTEAIDTALVTQFDESVVNKAVAFTTTAAEHNRTINVTAAATQSLGDATTMGGGYAVTIKNSHTAAITVDLATGTDTLDGTVDGSISLAPGAAVTVTTNQTADGYLQKGRGGNIIDTIYPVGSVYISTVATNPGTLFGVGTWVATGEGRVLVGVGTSDKAFALDDTGGASDAIVPAHTHTITDPGHTHTIDHGASAGAAGVEQGNPSVAGASTNSSTTGITETNSAGVSATDGNLQPYLTVHMWERTA